MGNAFLAMEHLRREDIPVELAFLEIFDALRIVLPPERQAAVAAQRG